MEDGRVEQGDKSRRVQRLWEYYLSQERTAEGIAERLPFEGCERAM